MKAAISADTRFGMLTVLNWVGYDGRGNRTYRFQCDCGSPPFEDHALHIRKSPRASCGCQWKALLSEARTTHSRSLKKDRTYSSWCSMRDRCKPSHVECQYYYGRGITICARWDDFEHFLADMGERPEGKTLDRINNDLGYTPENCRWATPLQQSRNRRSLVILTVDDQSLPLSVWSERVGIRADTIKARLDRGWSVERALTQLLRGKKEAARA